VCVFQVHCKAVHTGRSFTIPYDKLALCMGATTNTFGVPGVSPDNHVCIHNKLVYYVVVCYCCTSYVLYMPDDWHVQQRRSAQLPNKPCDLTVYHFVVRD
jgi:hypothetical protein